MRVIRQLGPDPDAGHRGLFSQSRPNRDSRFPESRDPDQTGIPLRRRPSAAGCRLRASSTITSSSGPCKRTLSHYSPAKLGGRRARAPPSAAAGWPRLPRPATPNGMAKVQTLKPGTRAGEMDGSVRRVHGDVRRVHGDVQPAARRSVLNYGNGNGAALTRLRVHQMGGC